MHPLDSSMTFVATHTRRQEHSAHQSNPYSMNNPNLQKCSNLEFYPRCKVNYIEELIHVMVKIDYLNRIFFSMRRFSEIKKNWVLIHK